MKRIESGHGNQPGAGERAALVRRGLRLNYPTIACNSIETVGSLAAGLVAGSVVGRPFRRPGDAGFDLLRARVLHAA